MSKNKINMPKRIQRKRTKGFMMPPNSVYVGRPTKFGNPWKVGAPFKMPTAGETTITADGAIRLYRHWLINQIKENPHFLDELRGKDLACWCSLNKPCHADVLLEFANR